MRQQKDLTVQRRIGAEKKEKREKIKVVCVVEFRKTIIIGQMKCRVSRIVDVLGQHSVQMHE